MKNDPLDSLNAVSAKATVAGASLTGWGYIMSNEFAGFLGVVIAAIGLLLNAYFGIQRNRRAALEHAARMAERQMRIDLMRSTQVPIMAPMESDYAKLEDTQ